MSDTQTSDDAELRKAVRREMRRLEQQSEAERKQRIQQAIEQAMAEELAETRADIEREADEIRDELTRDTREEEAARARRSAPGKILLLLLLFLILYLFAVATSRADIICFTCSRADAVVSASDQLTALQAAQAEPATGDNIPGVGVEPPRFYPVGDRFRAYWEQAGGERIFGNAISPEMISERGRYIQWYERARLEEWPENSDPAYKIQGGRLGVEYTDEMVFPTTQPFVSQEGQMYVTKTNYKIADEFLAFWEQNGGLDIFGYPISGPENEMIQGKLTRVQFFERARLEYHPDDLNGDRVKVGVLGTVLYRHLDPAKPTIVPPMAAPTFSPPPPTSATTPQPTATIQAQPTAPAQAQPTATPGLQPYPSPTN
jgi:hypothetical protein